MFLMGTEMQTPEPWLGWASGGIGAQVDSQPSLNLNEPLTLELMEGRKRPLFSRKGVGGLGSGISKSRTAASASVVLIQARQDYLTDMCQLVSGLRTECGWLLCSSGQTFYRPPKKPTFCS